MKLFFNAACSLLLTLSLSGHPVVDAVKGHSSLRKDLKLKSNSGRDLASKDRPSKGGETSGSCGCAGDGVRAIADAYTAALPKIIPLTVANPPLLALAEVVSQQLECLYKEAYDLLTNVDCGDCGGRLTYYCAEHWVSYGDYYGGKHDGHQTTYDCCCDVSQIVELTISGMTALTEKVILTNPVNGLPIYNDALDDTYALIATHFSENTMDAIEETAATFCPSESDPYYEVIDIENVDAPAPDDADAPAPDDGTN